MLTAQGAVVALFLENKEVRADDLKGWSDLYWLYTENGSVYQTLYKEFDGTAVEVEPKYLERFLQAKKFSVRERI